MTKKKSTVLVVPDLHCPFQHKDSFKFLAALKKNYSPTEVVCLGDEIDAHALSDYDHDPDGLSPGDELKKAIEELQPFYEMFKTVKVCTSNHTSRPYRKAYKHGIPRILLRDYGEFLMSPPEWVWADDWVVDGVIYEHGEGFSGRNGAINAALANMSPTVIGHLHSWAGIQYAANPKHLIWGFNAGCLIDREKYAFAYGQKMKNKPIVGAGIVKDGTPTMITMKLDKKGRWTGDL